MTRSVPEWIGKSDDEPVPPRVRLRVFERFGGVCGICTVKIRAKRWICDHKKALINGGENRERNLWPIHDDCDRKVKTPADVAEKKINTRVRAKHLGISKRKGRPMPGSRDSGIKMKIGGGWGAAMTDNRQFWIRAVLTCWLPFILVWAFFEVLLREMRSAFRHAWLEVRGNVEVYRAIMKRGVL